MAKHDEISSTEKLLNVIRGNREESSEVSDIETTPIVSIDSKPSLVGKITFKKKATIGVDIGESHLRLVATSSVGDKTPDLVNYSSIPYDPSIQKSSPQFAQFLKHALKGFCGTSKKIELWSVISSARVETRFIRVPKVASKQIANAVYWTYKKEVNFNDASDIFDFEVLGEVYDGGARKLEVIAYSAPRQEINDLRNIFNKIGYPLTGISIVPFAMQNFLRSRWINIESRNICNLFIGKDWSRIAIFSEGNLILSREIKSGIQSIVESIREKIGASDARPAAESVPEEETSSVEAGQEKGVYYDIEEAQQIFNRFIQEPGTGNTAAADIARQEKVLEMIVPALERVVRQVERTIQHYALNYKNEKIGKIFVSGEISANRQILDYIGGQLDLPIEVIDPFAIGLSLSDHFTVPATLSERGAYTPVIGIALSKTMLTPDFIHTYKDKEEINSAARLKSIAIAASFILAIIGAGAYYWQTRLIGYKKVEEAQLQRQVDRFIPYVDENLIMQMIARVQKDRTSLARYGQKYSGVTLMSVISKSTPSNIKLLQVTADFGNMPVEKSDGEKKDSGKKEIKVRNRLMLEGIIFGDRLTFESALAEYLVQLKKSPLFGKASVRNRSVDRIEATEVDRIEEKEVMKFTAELELI
ncbi:hypothetical protein ACFLZL_01920 [Thermodesulfobacteriota bacterium]